ncbi:MAG: tRNA (adenosine(37)-N6)-threonylcarbamoyltransferase complex ATPase subunit type 1 TsaE [Rickettsiales bacterium]|jgi:tRNA threonylcarbamoyl adenosine modification protein YjeE|nr:tRNA (adenosine(37)-N6)-threonylcarbamoyltransferase complex ATPase subunit type 1 TsaE [Rickettsiales bacterium]
MIYRSNSKGDTQAIAEDIARQTKNGTMIALSGDLGSGKTCFARAFIRYFFPREERANVNVTSPTFNLVKVYNTPVFTIYHLDLYRIKMFEELYELDIETISRNVSLVEWPDMIYRLRPKESVVRVKINIFDDHREFVLEQD